MDRTDLVRTMGRREAARETMAPHIDLAKLLDALDAAIIALAPERNAAGVIDDFAWVFANEASQSMMHLTWADMEGRTFRETLPDRAAVRLATFIEVYESGVAYSSESAASADEAQRWMEIHAQRMDDLVVVRFADITERQLLAAERSAAVATLEQVLGRISDAMYALDLEWRFTLVNRSAERLLGREGVDLLGRSLWDEFPHALGSDLERYYRQAVETGDSLTFDVYYPAPLDSWYRARAYPDSRGLTVHFSDIGVERRIEERVAHYDRLEGVTTLAGGVAHDFNNLLMVVSGHTSFLADDLPADHPGQEDVRAITLATERAAALTRQLLSYTGQQVVNPLPIDVNEALEGLGPELEDRLPASARFEVVPAADPAMVQVDPLELDRLVGHLVDNAAQAIGDAGRVVIEVSTAEVDDDTAAQFPGREAGCYIVIAVSDDGCGMAADVAARAIEPFFTTRRAEGATGLGLSAVHGITRQAGGHVVVYSEPRLGTTVRVFLPCTDAVAPVAPQRVETLTGTETVLVVDDNADVAGLVERLLSDAGYTVLVVGGGSEALDQLRVPGSEIALLVTDVVMPDMNGIELADAARSQLGSLPVLFVSGYTADTIADGTSRELVEFLAKPFSRTDLLERVRRLLDAAVPARAVPRVDDGDRPGN